MSRPAPRTWHLSRLHAPLADLCVLWDEAGRIVRIVLGGEVRPAEAFAARWGARLVAGPGVPEHLERLRVYLEGGPDPTDLPVRLLGTDFQQRAWQAIATARRTPACAPCGHCALPPPLASRCGGFQQALGGFQGFGSEINSNGT